jgi:hypothetical protein
MPTLTAIQTFLLSWVVGTALYVETGGASTAGVPPNIDASIVVNINKGFQPDYEYLLRRDD